MIRNIPKNYLIDTIIERLGDKWINLYADKFGNDYRSFLTDILYEEFTDKQNGGQKDPKKVRAYYKANRFNVTKKNWYKSVASSLNKKPTKHKDLLAEIDDIQSIIDRYGINKCKEIMLGATTMEEFAKRRLANIKEWVDNEKAQLIDFLYISEKTDERIRNALKIDAIMCITQFVLDEFDGDFNSIVREVSDLENDYALPGKTGEERLKPKKSAHTGTEFLLDEYEIAGELMIQTFLKDINKNERNAHTVKSLSPKDFDIFRFVMSRRDLDFIKDYKITVNVGDIVKAVYNSRSNVTYKLVEQKLHNLGQISFHIIGDKGDRITFGLFDTVIIKDYENGGSQAIISINSVIQQFYINNQVTRIYSDKIKNFNLSLSPSMVFALQKERFSKLREGSMDEKLFPYSYTFFERRLRFPSRNKLKNLKLIEESLEEIKASQVTISDFKKIGDEFYIAFFPVSDHEAEDLLQDSPSNDPTIQLLETI